VRITPRALQRVSSPRRQRRSLAMASKANCRNRNEQLPLPRPPPSPPRRRAAADAGKDRGRSRHRGTSQDATAPPAGGVDPGAAQAGAGRSPPRDLGGPPARVALLRVARTGRRWRLGCRRLLPALARSRAEEVPERSNGAGLEIRLGPYRPMPKRHEKPSIVELSGDRRAPPPSRSIILSRAKSSGANLGATPRRHDRRRRRSLIGNFFFHRSEWRFRRPEVYAAKAGCKFVKILDWVAKRKEICTLVNVVKLLAWVKAALENQPRPRLLRRHNLACD
jgi:hypothetical protein